MQNITAASLPLQAENLFSDVSAFHYNPKPSETVLAQKVLSSVLVTKPNKEWFFQIKPGWCLSAMILELKEDRDIYLVTPQMAVELDGTESCAKARLIRLGVTRQGNPFLWPMHIPDAQKPNSWHLSALDAAQAAETRWVRMQANMQAKCYDLWHAKVDAEPRWPEETEAKLLELAFKNKLIADPNHHALKALRGEA